MEKTKDPAFVYQAYEAVNKPDMVFLSVAIKQGKETQVMGTLEILLKLETPVVCLGIGEDRNNLFGLFITRERLHQLNAFFGASDNTYLN